MKNEMFFVFGILAIILACVSVSSAATAAEGPFLAEDVIIITAEDGDQDRIVVYHKASRSLLLYGNSSAKGSGLQLLQIRKLNNDIGLAARISDLDYRKKGYSPKDVKELLEKLQ